MVLHICVCLKPVQSVHVHTFYSGCIIYIHDRQIDIPVQLTMLILCKTLLGMLLQVDAE
jgi:hypothetical protein